MVSSNYQLFYDYFALFLLLDNEILAMEAVGSTAHSLEAQPAVGLQLV